MRLNNILIVAILMILSIPTNAQCPSSIKDTSSIVSTDTDIYKLIVSGQEVDVKNYFKNIPLEELIRSDSGAVVRAINRLKSNDKVTHTIWILEEVKNRNIELRRHIYDELNKVEYSRPPFLLKPFINSYFTNYTEPEDSLVDKVKALHKKMIK